MEHFIFDVLACFAALVAGLWQRWQLKLPDNPVVGKSYLLVLLLGCVVGGYGFGSWNLALGQQLILAHSVLGALVGAIVFIESYKFLRGIRQPTGMAYALPFCATVAVGRIGCFLAGLPDMTCGTPTALPWGVDFGDGIPRHPVQLYESFTMAVVGCFCAAWLIKKPPHYQAFAFPAVVGIYALQRFAWEFLKPYAAVVGGLNLFQLLCLNLLFYSALLIYRRTRHAS